MQTPTKGKGRKHGPISPRSDLLTALRTTEPEEPGLSFLAQDLCDCSLSQLAEYFEGRKGDMRLLRKILILKKQPLSGQTRHRLWKLLAQTQQAADQNHLQYRYLGTLTPHSEFVRTIEVDILRTQFTSPQKAEVARRVLRAVSIRCGMVGYCQGMNYVAGFLVSQPLSEEDIFWLMNHVLVAVLPLGHYTKLDSVLADCKVLQLMLASLSPALAEHLRLAEFDLQLVGVQWLICLFTNIRGNQPLLLDIWDRLLIHGYSALLQVLVAVVLHQKKQLMQTLDLGSILEVLSSALEKLTPAQLSPLLGQIPMNMQAFNQRKKDVVSRSLEPAKTFRQKCSKADPYCRAVVEQLKAKSQFLEYVALQEEGPPTQIQDYEWATHIAEPRASWRMFRSGHECREEEGAEQVKGLVSREKEGGHKGLGGGASRQSLLRAQSVEFIRCFAQNESFSNSLLQVYQDY